MEQIEILYHIFSFFDNRILLEIKSVCSFWNSVIHRILVCPTNNSVESLLLRSSQKLKQMKNADTISGTICAQYLIPQGILFIITYENIGNIFQYSLLMIDHVGSIVKRKLWSEFCKIYPIHFYLTKDLTFLRIGSRNSLSYYVDLNNLWLSCYNKMLDNQFFGDKQILTFQSPFSKPAYRVNNDTHGFYHIDILFPINSSKHASIDIVLTNHSWCHERFMWKSYQQHDIATNKSIILFHGHSTENEDFYLQIEQDNEIFNLIGMKVFSCSKLVKLAKQKIQYSTIFCHQRQRFFLTKIFSGGNFKLKPLVD